MVILLQIVDMIQAQNFQVQLFMFLVVFRIICMIYNVDIHQINMQYKKVCMLSKSVLFQIYWHKINIKLIIFSFLTF